MANFFIYELILIGAIMKIQSINVNNFIQNKENITNKFSTPAMTGNFKRNSIPVSSLSAENIKANFIPSFGQYRTVGYAFLIDKDTDKLQYATIQKEQQGNFGCFRVMVDRHVAGRMDICNDAVFPEEQIVLTDEPDNAFPEIRHIRSFMGNKYAGIGTILMNTAVQESKKMGKDGRLWLYAEKGYDFAGSPYRSNESPLPFYYKLGFRCPDEKTDKEIQKYIDKKQYNMLPDEAMLVLSADNVHILEDYFNSNFSSADDDED